MVSFWLVVGLLISGGLRLRPARTGPSLSGEFVLTATALARAGPRYVHCFSVALYVSPLARPAWPRPRP
jgi:hypothetical protein